MTRKCGECGKKVSEDAEYCGNCGNKVSKLEEKDSPEKIITGKRLTIGLLAVFLMMVVFMPGDSDTGDTESPIDEPDKNSESTDSNTKSYTSHYGQGSSKAEGNYLALEPEIRVIESEDSFNVTDMHVTAFNTLDREVEISSIALEFRQEQLHSLESRKTSWSERDSSWASQFDSKIIDSEKVGSSRVFSMNTDEDLKNLDKGCYNVTVTLRELKGAPHQGMYGDPNNFYVAGIRSQEVCMSENNTGIVKEVPEVQTMVLNEGDVPQGFKLGLTESNESIKYGQELYKASYLKPEKQAINHRVWKSWEELNLSESFSNSSEQGEKEYTKIDTTSDGTELYIRGNIEMSENQFTGRDTKVNMTVAMRKGKYNSVLVIWKRDYFTQDTEEIINQAARKMNVYYHQRDLEDAIEKYYPEEITSN